MMTPIRLAEVFVPGLLPRLTYVERNDVGLEVSIGDYLEERGEILTLAGPTKTGKSVLMDRVVRNPVKVEGGHIATSDAFWAMVGDCLGVHTDLSSSSSGVTKESIQSEVSGGLPGIVAAKIGVLGEDTDTRSTSVGVRRPMLGVVPNALLSSGRTLVVDDFHYVTRKVQTEIVRGLKPLLLNGIAVILISTSHRTEEVVNAEMEMGLRTRILHVNLWAESDLMHIATKGFAVLNVLDQNGNLARRLAKASFGSPLLMQRLCREICKLNGVRESLSDPRPLIEPQAWANFLHAHIDSDAQKWGRRVLRGPQERGGSRQRWKLKDGRSLDHYGLVLAALAATGPQLELNRDEIKASIERLVDGTGPTIDRTTRVLKHMSSIAAQRMTQTVPDEQELDAHKPGVVDAETQPVLEYVDQNGPTSKLHIADPAFAFYLANTTDLAGLPPVGAEGAE